MARQIITHFTSIALLAVAGTACAQQAPPPDATLNSRLTGDLTPTHDPVIIREGDSYHVFSTGHGKRLIETRSSKDLIHWTAGDPVFTALPAWATNAIPGGEGMWAPDISYVDGRHRLYYSVSTFGSNRSAIGLATSATLDPKAPGYGWRDEGLVVMSTRTSDYNAIDPNFVIDREGRHWLTLGSFWTGIKLFELDRKTGKPLHPDKPYSIARRPAPVGGPAPIEAPFIIDHGGYYWLMASYDYCCKGVNSTYYTVIGRSKAITGPYLGKDGSSMMNGGGTIFLRADLQEQQRWRGPGHAGWLHDRDGKDYVVYHAYDKQQNGAPTLRIAPVRWGADGWPVAEY
ncbi:arabinan endo-1,5-alpha-L-arabinosidase [Sphingobium bisphenolivorans]|uniref:arabinan endo-1,5-alpha-L-arabinosidase n=1 Tax=Sphingobium bisphenolivorans TaxID=1335760 RepID=UPI0003A1E354|nr:arabinan endo-1,5-alpha-L-arabinosidase [Sphingobium bisphenolivorans]